MTYYLLGGPEGLHSPPLTHEVSVVVKLSNSQVSGEAVFNSGNFQTFVLVQKYLGWASTACCVSLQDRLKDGGQEGTIASRLRGLLLHRWPSVTLHSTTPEPLPTPAPPGPLWEGRPITSIFSNTNHGPCLPRAIPSQVSRHPPHRTPSTVSCPAGCQARPRCTWGSGCGWSCLPASLMSMVGADGPRGRAFAVLLRPWTLKCRHMLPDHALPGSSAPTMHWDPPVSRGSREGWALWRTSGLQ